MFVGVSDAMIVGETRARVCGVWLEGSSAQRVNGSEN